MNITNQKSQLKIVLTSLSSDSHTWNLVFMQLYLEHYGHKVINLGACTQDEEIINECLNTPPNMLVVSTVNGHGFIDAKRLIKKINAIADMKSVAKLIGGKLGIKGSKNVDYIQNLLNEGFDGVYDESQSIDKFKKELEYFSSKLKSKVEVV